MTRDDLIKFLQKNYKPDEELVWQTMSFEDVAPYVERFDLATKELWEEFIQNQDYYGSLADDYSQRCVEEFNDFIQNQKEKE